MEVVTFGGSSSLVVEGDGTNAVLAIVVGAGGGLALVPIGAAVATASITATTGHRRAVMMKMPTRDSCELILGRFKSHREKCRAGGSGILTLQSVINNIQCCVGVPNLANFGSTTYQAS